MAGFSELTLGELFDSVTGGGTPPRAVAEYWNGNIPWASVKDFTDDVLKIEKTKETISEIGLINSTSKLIKAGTPLICLRMAVGRSAIASKDVSINQDVKALFTKNEVDSIYLVYLLDFIRSKIEGRSIGSTVKGISTSELLRIKVPFPDDLDTQQKIAKILSTVDNLIEKTQTLIDKYTAIKQGMMADLFNRGIDMTTGDTTNSKGGKLRPSVEDAPELYKQTELGWVPKEWEVTTLENEHQIYSGSTPSRQEVERYFKNGNIQWIKTLDLNETEIRTTEEQITQLALKESSCRLLPVNTVLIAMYGGWIQIGRTAILKAECATNQAICALIPNSEKLIPEFSMYYLQHFKEIWRKVAISTRKDPNITKSDVNRFPYLVPSVCEQKEIVLRINSINSALKNHLASREKLNKQKKGLMQDLLTGKVKVQ
jgi:type I restriction enzyme S subunit